MGAVVVAARRTPIGRAYKGSLVDVRPDDLLAGVIRAALDDVPALDRSQIEDVVVGCAQPAGEQGYNIARVAGLLAGLTDIPGVTVNRYCASSLQAVRMCAHAIAAGEGDVFVAAGVECVSRFKHGKADRMPDTTNPAFAEAGDRSEARAAAGAAPWTPGAGLPDIYIAMGQTAENVAQAEGVTRAAMDAFAKASQDRAVAAQAAGAFDAEIAPVVLPDGRVFDRDEGPRAGTRLEKLASLRPVFRPDGRVSAGNCCGLNDGAAAVVIMSEEKAAALGVAPLARIVATAVSAVNPEIMGMGPVLSSQKALARAGLTVADMDLVEINEAFAAQVLPSARRLGIPLEKLNVRGGAIALGHPFGMTGARILTTLIHAMRDTGGRYGLETMCVGGGQGMALVVEAL
jgi:acetyl-CoA C-acetyltransferase